MHLLVDSTGLKLCGSGEWVLEKHGTKTRRSWRKLHIAVDADTGQIAAATLISSDVDDAWQVGTCSIRRMARLRRLPPTVLTTRTASTATLPHVPGGTRHRSTTIQRRSKRHSPDGTTMRDRHLKIIAERGRIAWQKASGYHW